MFLFNKGNKKQKAFTIIELVVVIAIIGVLATIVTVSVQNYMVKARASRIVSEFENIEKAFHMLAAESNINEWWLETDFGLGSSPRISSIVSITTTTNPGYKFKNFLSTAPEPPISGAYYYYDNDGDTMSSYNCSCCTGVNIILYNCGSLCSKYFDVVNELVDGDEQYPKCQGKVRTNSSVTYISISIATSKEDF